MTRSFEKQFSAAKQGQIISVTINGKTLTREQIQEGLIGPALSDFDRSDSSCTRPSHPNEGIPLSNLLAAE